MFSTWWWRPQILFLLCNKLKYGYNIYRVVVGVACVCTENLSCTPWILLTAAEFVCKFQQLLLHGNRISQLRQCERHLPPSIVMLTLASNNITDLNEISHLVHLTSLREFTIMNNPCVNMTGNCMYPYNVLAERNMKWDITLLVCVF